MKIHIIRTLILLFCSSSVAAQTTVNIPAFMDNTIYQNPAANSNALGQNIFSGTNGNSSPRRGLIKFDVAAVIPTGATVTSVTLILNCNLSRAVSDDVSLHKLLANWGEGTSNAGSLSDGSGAAATANDATWSARFFPAISWATPGGDYNATPSATVSVNDVGFYQWSSSTLAADVQTWINMPETNFGWLLVCNETTGSTARKFGSRENTTVSNRPSLAVTYTTALPVNLTNFKATAKEKAIVLTWETLQEINNHYFELLHSTDGVLFSSVAKINGHGTTAIKQYYSYHHEKVAAGNHFYKLAQIGFDGTQKYSSVESVFTVAASGDVAIFPNPLLTDFKIFSGTNLLNATYQIINQSGKVLLSGRVGLQSIRAEALIPGTYYLCIYKNNKLVNSALFCKL